jgi:hypothetical protein
MFKYSIDVTVYHEGSDGGQFDWIEIFTTTQKVRCYLGKQRKVLFLGVFFLSINELSS